MPTVASRSRQDDRVGVFLAESPADVLCLAVGRDRPDAQEGVALGVADAVGDNALSAELRRRRVGAGWRGERRELHIKRPRPAMFARPFGGEGTGMELLDGV